MTLLTGNDRRRIACVVYAGVCFSSLLFSQCSVQAQKRWDKYQWDKLVRERSTEIPPQPGKIICIGSSHMARWTSVANDLAPLKVYNFGIGGSTMRDAADVFAKKLVIPYKPRAVILYEGSNDIARGTSPAQILEQFQDFYSQVRRSLPSTRFYVLGIVPSPGKRFEKWETIQRANNTLRKECQRYPWLTYIDTTSGLIGDDQQPRMECFLKEDIHMNSKGYNVWASEVAPVVLVAEKKSKQVDARIEN